MDSADREFVLPGAQVAETGRFDQTCFREEGKIYSSVAGLYRSGGRELRVIPSSGPYIPKEGDLVIGVVTLIFDTFWLVDIGSPYRSIILKDEVVKTRDRVNLRDYFQIGDVISGK
ncbi:MAG: RNA-binding protein, partial [Candidatus Altiarchaeota archaeon]